MGCSHIVVHRRYSSQPVLERDAFRVACLELGCHRIRGVENLEVIGVSDLFRRGIEMTVLIYVDTSAIAP
jgi:hypothetical protein